MAEFWIAFAITGAIIFGAALLCVVVAPPQVASEEAERERERERKS